MTCINEYWILHHIRLGGFGNQVQVYETKLNFNVKSHRGTSTIKLVWTITIVDITCNPTKVYADIVKRRDDESLIPIISSVVRPVSIITTDEWRAYNNFMNINDYYHRRVCHKYNFVDPETGNHTQHVESFNNKLKLALKKEKV
ncbi:hypothetical protein DMUE_5961 [Dictyocoela muelleri]|nr:hypothetical protein DMUE_5961 [Dictyocoela muelleri]